jgi:hypothetical protein
MNLKKIGLGAVLLFALIALLSLAPSLAAIEPHHTVMTAMAVSVTIAAPQSAFTITEFCRRNAISKAMFYKICAAGHGPRLMKVGTHSRISVEAEADWKRAREAEVAAKQNNQHEAGQAV